MSTALEAAEKERDRPITSEESEPLQTLSDRQILFFESRCCRLQLQEKRERLRVQITSNTRRLRPLRGLRTSRRKSVTSKSALKRRLHESKYRSFTTSCTNI